MDPDSVPLKSVKICAIRGWKSCVASVPGRATLRCLSLLSAHDAIHGCAAFDDPKRSSKFDHLVAGKKRAHFRRGIERFRNTDLARISEGLNACSDIHSLTEIVQVVIQRHGDRRSAVRADLED